MAAIYSIRELETLSGIKAHTIRMWEQRYGILKAARTETNIRFYSDSELKYLMSIALLNRNGYKISKVAAMSQEEVGVIVTAMLETPSEYATQIDGLTIATIEYDEEKFERITGTAILQLGFEEAMKKIVFPFLQKIGVMWMSGSVIAAQEHFVSNLIRQKLIVAIDGQSKKILPGAKKFLLFLPNAEWHELSLLFLSYLLQARHQKVVYLGASVPIKEVMEVGDVLMPDYYYTIISSALTYHTVPEYLNKLANHFPQSQVLASGSQVIELAEPIAGNVETLPSMEAVLQKIDRLTQYL